MNSVMDNTKQHTRDIILRALKQHNQATVETLATVADVSPVTVRHHLNSLQAEGLLTLEAVRRKVGRPYYLYGLSEKGHDLFPKRYARLSSRLLDELKSRFPPEVVTELFNGVVQTIVAEQREDFQHLTFEEKLTYLVNLLGEEGFLARWEKVDNNYVLTEYSCPYISVGQTHAEICIFDRELVISILNMPVVQHSCMLHGDGCCQFSVESPIIQIQN